MKKLIIIFSLLFAINSYGQEYFKWRIAHEKWVGKDKIFHITGNYLICAGLHAQCKLKNAMLITSLIGLAWEIKDAWLPYEKVGDWGGRGFSYSDYILGNAGILLYATSSYIFSKLKSPKKPLTVSVPKELKINVKSIGEK